VTYAYAVHPGRDTTTPPLAQGDTPTLSAASRGAVDAVLAAGRARHGELEALGDLLGDMDSERGAVKTFRFDTGDRFTAHVWRTASTDPEQDY